MGEQASAAGDSVERFAADLKQLRLDAGLTVRGLAAKAVLSKTAVSDATSGERIPSDIVLKAYLRGVGVETTGIQEWQQRAVALRTQTGRRDGNQMPTSSGAPGPSVATDAYLPEEPNGGPGPLAKQASVMDSASVESPQAGAGVEVDSTSLEHDSYSNHVSGTEPLIAEEDPPAPAQDSPQTKPGAFAVAPEGLPPTDRTLDEPADPTSAHSTRGRARRRMAVLAATLSSLIVIAVGGFVLGRLQTADADPAALSDPDGSASVAATPSRSDDVATSIPAASTLLTTPVASSGAALSDEPTFTSAPSTTETASMTSAGPSVEAVDPLPVTSLEVPDDEPTQDNPEPATPPVTPPAQQGAVPEQQSEPTIDPPPNQQVQAGPSLLNPPVGPTVGGGNCPGELVGEHNHKVGGVVAATTLIYYQSSTGKNCALLRKRVHVGESSYIGLTLCNARGECATDRDYYPQEAGPVSIYGKSMCITFAISMLRPDRTDWILTPQKSDPSHCT